MQVFSSKGLFISPFLDSGLVLFIRVFFKYLFIFNCTHMDVLHVPMFVHHVGAWCPRSEERVRSCVSRASDSCEPLCNSRKQTRVLRKNSLGSWPLCYRYSLELGFWRESQSVQFPSHRREGCRLSPDCLQLHDREVWLAGVCTRPSALNRFLPL